MPPTNKVLKQFKCNKVSSWIVTYEIIASDEPIHHELRDAEYGCLGKWYIFQLCRSMWNANFHCAFLLLYTDHEILARWDNEDNDLHEKILENRIIYPNCVLRVASLFVLKWQICFKGYPWVKYVNHSSWNYTVFALCYLTLLIICAREHIDGLCAKLQYR